LEHPAKIADCFLKSGFGLCRFNFYALFAERIGRAERKSRLHQQSRCHERAQQTDGSRMRDFQGSSFRQMGTPEMTLFFENRKFLGAIAENEKLSMG
jgi:hypothetical protein